MEVKLKRKLKRLINVLILNIEVALIFSFIIFSIILILNVFFFITGQPIGTIWAFIQVASAILAFFILVIDIHDRIRQKKNIKNLKKEFEQEIAIRVDLCKQSLNNYINSSIDSTQKIIDSFVREYFTSFANERRISKTLESEIMMTIPKKLLTQSGISEAEIIFLTYVFLNENEIPYLQEFINSLNRNNMYKTSSEEYKFLEYLAAYEKYSIRDGSLFRMLNYIGEKNIDELRARLLGNLRMYHSIEKLEKQRRFHVKLIKIVERIMKSKIAKKTLSKMSESPRDLICVIRYKEKIPDKSKSPFNKVFLDKHNFLRPFSKWSIYIKPLDEMPKRYGNNFKLYIKELIKEVEKIWDDYKRDPRLKKYVDIMRGPTYQYLAFNISGYNLVWGERNTSFKDQFKTKVLEKLDKSGIINFLIFNKEEVRKVISQMEIDNLLEDARDSIKTKLYENEDEIRKRIFKKIGFKITDITSYRKLKKHKDDFLSILEPYLGDIDKKEKDEIIDAIIENSDDYNKILHEISLTVT